MANIMYTTVGSNKLEEAKQFYDALMSSIGVPALADHPSGGRVYGDGGHMFGVLGPHNGEPATFGNGSMNGFSFDTREQVDAFHAKVLELGGTCDGPPGERFPGGYFTYVRDLDGNKLCGYKLG
jgi:catechol 2,3-dioxygenase-like lactoylglutathione lyase family enzyme